MADSNGRYLDSHLRATLPPSVEVLCHFLPGGTSRDCLDYIKKFNKTFTLTINAVIMHFGSNDVGRMCNAQEVLRNIESLGQCARICFHCPIFMTSVLPQVGNRPFNDKVRYINKRLPHILQSCLIILLDVTFIFLKSHRVLSIYFSHDGIHLNWEGKMLLAAIFHWVLRCRPHRGTVLPISDIGFESQAQNQSVFVY